MRGWRARTGLVAAILAVVMFTVLRLLGGSASAAAALAVGVSAALALPLILGERWLRSEMAAVDPDRTGRRILGITALASLAVATFIVIYVTQLIPRSSFLGLFLSWLGLALGLIALAGAAAVGVTVVYWRSNRTKPWAIRLAIAMAVYLAIAGVVFLQPYLVVLSAGFGMGAYRSRRTAAAGALTA